MASKSLGAGVGRTRATPSQKRSALTYEKILEASLAILHEEGPEGFNTNAIAERANVNVGTVYHYFGDKWAVLYVMMERMQARGKKIVLDHVAQLASTPSPYEWSDGVLRKLHETRLAYPGSAQLRALCRTVPELAALDKRVEATSRQLIFEAISLRIPRLPPERCEGVAYVIAQVGSSWLDRVMEHEAQFENTLHEMAQMLGSYIERLENEYR